MRYECIANTETLFRKKKLCLKGVYLRGCFLTIRFIYLTWQNYPQKISKILSLHRKVKPVYTQKSCTDQPQTLGGLFIFVEKVIKSENSFYKK